MKSVVSKISYNFFGNVLPMVVGLVTIPLLIDKIGIERFGMLSIAWMLVGYFGLLDMGVSRALTHKVADRIGKNQTDNLNPIIYKAFIIVFLFGVVGSICLILASNYIVYDFFNIDKAYQIETTIAIYWIAAIIPLAIVSSAVLGLLEGQQYFLWTAIIRAPLGSMMFIAPLIATTWSTSLDTIICSLFILRMIFFVILLFVAKVTTREYTGNVTDNNEIKSLFKYGGWITVSNIISPVMVYFDRFYIGSVLAVSVVAYYTTPFDFLTKVLIIPFAIAGVMFSRFSTNWKINKKNVIFEYNRSFVAVIFVMLPISTVFYLFSEELLSIWLGHEFSKNSFIVAQIISIGIFINAIGMLPFALLQSTGRADLTAKIHMLELPVYAFLLWYFIKEYGLVGAAIAWVIRVSLDAFILILFANNIIKKEIKNAK